MADDKLKNIIKISKPQGENELAKGSAQRRMPFNPVQEKAELGFDGVNAIGEWQTLAEDRDVVPRMSPETKTRALHYLSGQTKVRVDPATKQRQFLLHRTMSEDELNTYASKDRSTIRHHDSTSSWTPDETIANGFAGTKVSAWVPESHIHSMPRQYGAMQDNFSNKYAHEKEVIVAPKHTSQIHAIAPSRGSIAEPSTVDARINQRGADKKRWPSVSVMSKSESIFQDLKKGSAQRKMPFNPLQEKAAMKPEDRKAIDIWQTEETRSQRKEIPAMSPEAKARTLSFLSGQTQVRIDPQTKQKSYLLHRAMSRQEMGAYMDKDQKTISHHNASSSWTPDLTIANGLQGINVSAWIPESHIHSMPKQYGDPNSKSANSFQYEKEIIVAPGHVSQVHAIQNGVKPATDINTRINTRQQRKNMAPTKPVMTKSMNVFQSLKKSETQVGIGDGYTLLHLHSNNPSPDEAAKGYSSVDHIELRHPNTDEVLAGATVMQGLDVEPIVKIGFIQESHRGPKVAQKAFDALQSKYQTIPQSVLQFMETVWGIVENGPSLSTKPASTTWQSVLIAAKKKTELTIPELNKSIPFEPDAQYVKITGHNAWHKILGVKDTGIKAGMPGGGNNYTVQHADTGKPHTIHQSHVTDHAFGDELIGGLHKSSKALSVLKKAIEPIKKPEGIPEIGGRASKLANLGAQTRIGMDATTGKKAYLVYRGMDEQEHQSTVTKDGYVQNAHQSTWSVDSDVAQKFGSGTMLVGAWVAEDNIHLAEKAPNEQYDPQTHHFDMYKVMVLPDHKSKMLPQQELEQILNATKPEPMNAFSAGNGYFVSHAGQDQWDVHHMSDHKPVGRIQVQPGNGSPVISADINRDHKLSSMEVKIHNILMNHYSHKG